MAQARAWTRELVQLPAGEGVELEIVRDEPWLGFCYYLGGLQSRISVNVDLPKSASEILHLTMHETYPGHHAERCVKEQLLVLEGGLLEETIVLVPTPQSIVAEGIAELAPAMVLESGAGQAIAEIVQDAGIEFDLASALAIERAGQPLRWAEVNAALLLHDAGAGEAETQAYLERWGLMTAELATHLIRFLNEPTSRSYMITYAAGRDVCGAWVAGDPERFRRLLTEQVRVEKIPYFYEPRVGRHLYELSSSPCEAGAVVSAEAAPITLAGFRARHRISGLEPLSFVHIIAPLRPLFLRH
jgi:hypothetical protein